MKTEITSAKHSIFLLRGQSRTAGNSTYTQGGVSCPADTFVEAESSVLRTNFCAKNPALRVAAKR